MRHCINKLLYRIDSNTYFKKKLLRVGVDFSVIPDKTINEIVALAEEHAKFMTYDNPRLFFSVFNELLDVSVAGCYNAQRIGLDAASLLEHTIANLKQGMNTGKR